MIETLAATAVAQSSTSSAFISFEDLTIEEKHMPAMVFDSFLTYCREHGIRPTHDALVFIDTPQGFENLEQFKAARVENGGVLVQVRGTRAPEVARDLPAQVRQVADGIVHDSDGFVKSDSRRHQD